MRCSCPGHSAYLLPHPSPRCLCTSRYDSSVLDSRPWAGIQPREIPHLTELRAVANGQADLSLLADIDQLIAISGMVIRTSQLIPEMQEAFFQCQVCAHTARVEMDRGRIAEPCVCERCHTTHSMALIHNRSVFSDKQMVRGLPGWHVCLFVLLFSGSSKSLKSFSTLKP